MVRRYFSMGMVCLHNLEAIKLSFLVLVQILGMGVSDLPHSARQRLDNCHPFHQPNAI